MTQKASHHEQTFGIGAVSKMTGLSDHTIRIWERRYQAVVAERAANGRRVYSAADVEKLNLLRILTEQGHSIGRIANESVEELAERAASVRELSAAPVPEAIRTAVLGDFVPAKMQGDADNLAPLQLVAADSSEQRFEADVRQQPVDVLVIELPVAGAETLNRIDELIAASGAERAVLVYSFGRTADIDRIRERNVVVLRAPVSVDEIKAAVVRAYGAAPAPRKRRATTATVQSDWPEESAVQPRLFSQQQLAELARVSSTIECECPQHLAQLVGDLSAFEVYSANCANRDDEDALLHRYLHRTTAMARAMIEQALHKVAKAEGLL